MLRRGFLISSQLYVMWPHTGELVCAMLAALEDSLMLVTKTHERGALKAESGVDSIQQGFARLV
jgi:hypothetical protein